MEYKMANATNPFKVLRQQIEAIKSQNPELLRLEQALEDLRTQERNAKHERRIQEKLDILIKYDTSEELFDALRDEVNTLSYDESSNDLSIDNEYSFGVGYDIELLLDIINDLREFTRYIKYDDDESITKFGLDYLRSVYNAAEMCED
jgi:hypothetical protein